MSFSYAVGGGKSLTSQRRGKTQGNSTTLRKPASLTSPSTSNSGAKTKSSEQGKVTGASGRRVTNTGAHPPGKGNNSGYSGVSAASSNSKRSQKRDDSFQGNIVTLTDLKAKRTDVPSAGSSGQKDAKAKISGTPSKNKIPGTGTGKKLGTVQTGSKPLFCDSNRTTTDNSTKALVQEYESLHDDSRTTKAKPKTKSKTTLNISAVNICKTIRSSKSETESESQTSKNKVRNRSTCRNNSFQQKGNSSSPKGRGRGEKMADSGLNNGLYSSNARAVGQRPPREGGISNQGENQSSQGQGTPQRQEGDAQYVGSGGYTMITPNQRRREQLRRGASEELQAYEARRAARTPAVIQGPAQRTGGERSEEEARRALEREHQNKKYDQIRKREQYLKEKKEREDREYEEKKAKAREQAKRNKERQAQREENFLMDDHARTNDDFLRRLEAGQSHTPDRSSPRRSPELQRLMEMFPQKDADKLQRLLDMNHGDVNEVINLLT